MATAATTMTPKAMYCVGFRNPSSVPPLAMTPIVTVPASVPSTVPRPPLKLPPPMTTAAINLSSKPVPAVGFPELSREKKQTAAMPKSNPAKL